jgi:hypothetical protein
LHSNSSPTPPGCIGRHDDPPAAEVGYLCLRCFSRLRSALLEIPAIATWLHVNLAAGGAPGEKVSGSREDPIPLRVDVLDLIGPDSLRFVAPVEDQPLPAFMLWDTGVLIGYYPTWREAATARSQEMRLAGVEPDVIRLVTGRPSRKELRDAGIPEAKLAAARERWQIRPTERGGCDQRGEDAFRAALRYYSARVSEQAGISWADWYDRNDLTGLVDWLAKNLTWIVEQEWVTEFAETLEQLTRQAHRIAPWKAHIVRDREPCESCGVAAIIVRMAEGRSICEPNIGGCGRVITWDHKAHPRHSHDKPAPPTKQQINTGEAAALARVQPATIRSWARRGKLPEASRDSNNRPLYDTATVVKVAQEQDERRRDLTG